MTTNPWHRSPGHFIPLRVFWRTVYVCGQFADMSMFGMVSAKRHIIRSATLLVSQSRVLA